MHAECDGCCTDIEKFAQFKSRHDLDSVLINLLYCLFSKPYNLCAKSEAYSFSRLRLIHSGLQI